VVRHVYDGELVRSSSSSRSSRASKPSSSSSSCAFVVDSPGPAANWGKMRDPGAGCMASATASMCSGHVNGSSGSYKSEVSCCEAVFTRLERSNIIPLCAHKQFRQLYTIKSKVAASYSDRHTTALSPVVRPQSLDRRDTTSWQLAPRRGGLT